MCKLIVIKSNSKYEGAFYANLNVIKHNAMKVFTVFNKSNTKYLIPNYKK